jgi:hypothetical protein
MNQWTRLVKITEMMFERRDKKEKKKNVKEIKKRNMKEIKKRNMKEIKKKI